MRCNDVCQVHSPNRDPKGGVGGGDEGSNERDVSNNIYHSLIDRACLPCPVRCIIYICK